MKIQVNLATRPFVELRPYMLRLRWIMGCLAVVSFALVVSAHLLQKKLDVGQSQMHAIQARTDAAVAEKHGNERRMRQPVNAAVLDRAHFLNTLFLRKSFSWTAVMMDLETVLPSGVQVTSIEPGVTADGDVIIRMRVAGDRDRAVQLVRNLEHSKRFLHPRLSSEAVQAKDLAQAHGVAGGAAGSNVEFEILANYNPLPEGETYARVKVDDSSKVSRMVGHSYPTLMVRHGMKPSPISLKPMAPMQTRQQAPVPHPSVQPQVKSGPKGGAA